MSEQGWIAVITLIVGAGVTGALKIIGAVRGGFSERAQRKSDAEARLIKRLEDRLDSAEAKIAELEAAREDDAQYIVKLVVALAGAGIEVPCREED